jgi:hypothetical protein
LKRWGDQSIPAASRWQAAPEGHDFAGGPARAVSSAESA